MKNIFKNKKFIITLIFIMFINILPMLALAQNECNSGNTNEFGLCIGIENPLGDKKDLKDIIGIILNSIADIVLPIVIVMVIYSGFLYVIARGKPEAIKDAHKALTWTLVGAAVLLGARLIANVLIDTVSSIGNDSGYNSTTTSNSYKPPVNTGSNSTNTNNNTNNSDIKDSPDTSIEPMDYPIVISNPWYNDSILNNAKVGVKILSFTSNSINYTLNTDKTVSSVQLLCRENKLKSLILTGDSQNSNTIPEFNNGLVNYNVQSGIEPLTKDLIYICALEYRDSSSPLDSFMTKSFHLYAGQGNK